MIPKGKEILKMRLVSFIVIKKLLRKLNLFHKSVSHIITELLLRYQSITVNDFNQNANVSTVHIIKYKNQYLKMSLPCQFQELLSKAAK